MGLHSVLPFPCLYARTRYLCTLHNLAVNISNEYLLSLSNTNRTSLLLPTLPPLGHPSREKRKQKKNFSFSSFSASHSWFLGNPFIFPPNNFD